MKAAILGTSGYTGLILLRLLAVHPEVKEIIPVSSSKAGLRIEDFDAGISRTIKEKMTLTKGLSVTLEEAAEMNVDVAFAALPHLKSAELCGPFFDKSVVIDLSADLRIKDPAIFQAAYGTLPPREDLLSKAVYGLSEWHREEIKKADLIANPGCYPTCTLLPLLPLLKEGVVKERVVVNAISGVSGAGKKAKEYLLYTERTENACAYSPGRSHRHTLEIESQVKGVEAAGKVFFTPHLAPLKRGMVATTYTELTKSLSREDILGIYDKYYGKAPFVCIQEKLPESRDVWGSNRCDINFHLEGDSLILMSAIDNLVKGASGQAVQNMNIRFGFDETAGLSLSNEL